MYRFGILGFLLSPLVIGAFPNLASAPVVGFSYYAPVQKDSPVHIVGLRYDYPNIEIDLENATDVPVDGIGIFAVAIAPRGCGAEPRKTLGVADTQVRPVRIGPRGTGEASGNDSTLDSGGLIFSAARLLEAAYLHVQVGVAEVDFSDGTKWRPQIEPGQTLLDASLLAADDGKCLDVAGVADALKSIHVVQADHRVDAPSYGDPGEGTPAPLHFSCRLEGSNGYCPQGRPD
jgi:hypothetical protein